MEPSPLSVSVIIPVGPAEQHCGRLINDLLLLPPTVEIIFSTSEQNEPVAARDAIDKILTGRPVTWLTGPSGRATQLNAGAAKATGHWLWFVHWDSGFGPELWQQLQQALANSPDKCSRLYYFDLGFAGKSALMSLNQRGANLRSRWLHLPFGDQGFCLSAALFNELGGYPQQLAYGEDHVFVWRLHQWAKAQGVRGCLHRLPVTLVTSARKYRQQGWLRLTLKYQYWWLKQALPQLRCLLRTRRGQCLR